MMPNHFHLYNKNVSGTVILGLRRRGHDVLSVKELMRPDCPQRRFGNHAPISRTIRTPSGRTAMCTRFGLDERAVLLASRTTDEMR